MDIEPVIERVPYDSLKRPLKKVLKRSPEGAQAGAAAEIRP